MDPSTLTVAHLTRVARQHQPMVDVIRRYEGSIIPWQRPRKENGDQLQPDEDVGSVQPGKTPRWYERTQRNQRDPWDSVFERVGN